MISKTRDDIALPDDFLAIVNPQPGCLVTGKGG